MLDTDEAASLREMGIDFINVGNATFDLSDWDQI